MDVRTEQKKGTLYLVPTPLGEVSPHLVMPLEALQLLPRIRHMIVEQLRTARRLLKMVDQSMNLDDIVFNELNKHTDPAVVRSFLGAAANGYDMALLSEAGSPCVADPGAVVVQQAHEMGIQVRPLAGPSAIIQALMASGFNGQSFAFHGYLPIQPDERNRWIKQAEKESLIRNQTQIFIETPFRNGQLLEALLKNCQPSTRLCVACQISTAEEWIFAANVAGWKNKRPEFHKKPAVFLLWNPPKNGQ